MVWKLVTFSKNNLQWSHLPAFSLPPLILNVKKLSMRKLKFKLFYGVFGMLLFFRIRICYVRTIFFPFHNLATITKK